MTQPAQQMPLGRVPDGWLATTAPDGTAAVFKMARDAAGQVTGHTYGADPATTTFAVTDASQLASLVYTMPDPADPFPAAAAAVQSAFPGAAPVAATPAPPAPAPSAAPAQQVPETGQAAALSPLVRAAVALFDANTMPAVAGAKELAGPFKVAALAVSRGPRGPRTIAALELLLQARAMAALALFEPNV